MTTTTLANSAKRETLLFAGFFAFGLLLLPAAIYLVGQAVFGTYGGEGIGAFYSGIMTRIRNGDIVGWFLILSPYIFVQLVRLAFMVFRWLGERNESRP